MHYNAKLSVCSIGGQVAHRLAVTVFLHSCESTLRGLLLFLCNSSPRLVLTSAGRLAGLSVSQNLPPPPQPPPHALFRLTQELSGIQTFLIQIRRLPSPRSRTLTAKPQRHLQAAETKLTCKYAPQPQVRRSNESLQGAPSTHTHIHIPELDNKEQTVILHRLRTQSFIKTETERTRILLPH